MSKHQPVNERSMTDDSLSDIEFDKTDDDLLDNNQPNSTSNHISTGFDANLNKDYNRKIENERRLSRECKQEIQLENSSFRKRKSSINYINYPSSPKKGKHTVDIHSGRLRQYDLNISFVLFFLNSNTYTVQQPDDLLKLDDKPHIQLIDSYDTLEELERGDQFDENKLDSLGQFKSGTSISSQMNVLSQSAIKQRMSIPDLSDLNELKIDKRPHQFVTKKVFRPEKCGPCGQSIGFCTSGYHCRDCRAICHMSCKDLVPLPCIPYVSRANIGKQGKLVLISDYVPQNVRPCVPALIIHCCTEIEKRGLEKIGPYRICGSKKNVTEFKERILDSKKGMPNLNTVDIYVLCGIVKDFLNSLDESLITKLAWRDFVTGAALKDNDQRTSYLHDLISNLHVANRDTLAYIILHLLKIAVSPDCKMPTSSLAKVFGPTIVGFSMKGM